MQQKAATTSASQQVQTSNVASQQAPNSATSHQPSHPSQHPYLITAEMAERLVPSAADQMRLNVTYNPDVSSTVQRFVPMSKRKPKAKRGMPQEGLKTIDPSEYYFL